ncbi:MAG: hypothetical protein ACLPPF_18960 [Rhodomicrobium sp.]
MRYVWAVLVICAAATHALAECPTRDTITAWGSTFDRGGLLGALSDKARDCDTKDQPAWIAKINEAAPPTGTAPGLQYCRQVVQNKDPQYEAQHRDCVFWYGHSIEVR